MNRTLNYKLNALSRRAVVSGLAIALTLVGSGLAPRAAFAHETNCPFCKLKVVQDTKEQDNEVALRYGRKRIEYRCVWCALYDTQNGKYGDSDVTILAPTEKVGQPIPITRTGGKWAAPEGVVFVGVKASHRVCQITYRSFTTKAAFDAYVQKNQVNVKGASPLTLEQMLAIAKPDAAPATPVVK